MVGLENPDVALTLQAQERKRLYGVYSALVKSITDPDNQGRVRIRLPWAGDKSGNGYEAWARLSTMMAGKDRGTWFIPDEGDEVLIVFADGDPNNPCVIGTLWNGKDSPPEKMDRDGKNNKKVIVSRNNIRIILDDNKGQETVTIQTPGGQKVVLKDGPSQVEITDSSGNQLKMETAGITLSTAKKLTIQAGTISVSAGMVSVDSGLSKFSGVVKSDVAITNSVVSTSYTPGAGNIW